MFRTNLPVTADGFVNREKELSQLDALVERLTQNEPTWLAIIGPRKIGKTSILLELTRRFDRPSLAFVVLDVFEEMPLSLEIFRRYALRILDGVFSAELGVSLESAARHPAEFRLALQHSPRYLALPAALRGMLLELPDRKADSTLVEDALRLPSNLAEALDLHILVAWDEFQALAELRFGRGHADPLPLMRSIWQRHRRVAYVISGSQRTMLLSLVTQEHSPFFQHFNLMEIGPFDEGAANDLLERGATGERAIPRNLARKAVSVLGRHPFYLQLLGEVLTALPPPYENATLKRAIQELLFSRTGRLALYFENIYNDLVGRSTFLAAVLRALAPGPARLTDISKTIGAPTGSTVRYLERLADAVVHRDDGLYALADETFGLWLRWRQPGGTVVPMTVVGDETERGIAEHLARMGFDLVYQSRGSRGAFDLLATRGAQQLAVQVKRVKLPVRFTLEAWNRMCADGVRFHWRWVVAVVSPPPESRVSLLDPGRARIKKEVRLAGDARIENLLLWLERTPERRPAAGATPR